MVSDMATNSPVYLLSFSFKSAWLDCEETKLFPVKAKKVSVIPSNTIRAILYPTNIRNAPFTLSYQRPSKPFGEQCRCFIGRWLFFIMIISWMILRSLTIESKTVINLGTVCLRSLSISGSEYGDSLFELSLFRLIKNPKISLTFCFEDTHRKSRKTGTLKQFKKLFLVQAIYFVCLFNILLFLDISPIIASDLSERI